MSKMNGKNELKRALKEGNKDRRRKEIKELKERKQLLELGLGDNAPNTGQGERQTVKSLATKPKRKPRVKNPKTFGRDKKRSKSWQRKTRR